MPDRSCHRGIFNPAQRVPKRQGRDAEQEHLKSHQNTSAAVSVCREGARSLLRVRAERNRGVQMGYLVS